MRSDLRHAPTPAEVVELADWLLRSPSDTPQVAAYRRSTAELVVGAGTPAEAGPPPWWQELGAGWALEVWLEHHGPEAR